MRVGARKSMILRHVKLTLPSVCDGLPSSGIAGRLFLRLLFSCSFSLYFGIGSTMLGVLALSGRASGT